MTHTVFECDTTLYGFHTFYYGRSSYERLDVKNMDGKMCQTIIYDMFSLKNISLLLIVIYNYYIKILKKIDRYLCFIMIGLC